MKLKCISTGSIGNTYALISNGGEILLLDVGASEKDILKAINYEISSVVGAVATHKHIDHLKSADKLERRCVEIFKPFENGEHKQIIPYNAGKFEILAFALDDVSKKHWQHTNTDGTECANYGFYITHPEMNGPFIYCTDTKLIKWNFKSKGPANILLGVDYQEDLLDEDSAKYRHQLEGHMSIDVACEFVKSNRTDNLKNVILGHLSGDSADSDYFIEEMKKVVDCDVYVARKGFEKEMNAMW